MSSTSSSSSSSSSTSSPENTLASDIESRSSQVGTSTLRSQVGTFTPQASTSFPRRDALGDIKDEAKDKFNEETWLLQTTKGTNEQAEQCRAFGGISFASTFTARVPALQELANYGTDLEMSVYEGQIRSGYRLPMHPYAVAFFNYYNMALAQLVPNGWRKLLGLFILFEPRVRIIRRGPKSNKGWHSRYFFIQRSSGRWEFPRKWNAFCKDYEKKGFLAPDAHTKKLLDHIKRRGAFCIDEPLTDQKLRHARLISPTPVPPLPPTPVVEPRVVLGHKSPELVLGHRLLGLPV
ncbi:hypothetical protein RJ639_005442 [Escallonia herrerae]|uniref:Uncharacterized protein n=1 Tax=Escallonia herrerae TaxID=1293975 RepID=A0AA88VXB1_9ASTE|nr:hypothetical protein RJ639_005442 [Escallonia herrerae]